MDRQILLWRATGDCANERLLTGHKSAVLDLQWSRDSQVLYSASADGHVASWHVETGARIRRHEGHDGVINCLDVSRRGEEFLVSGGDDGTVGVWDPRRKAALTHLTTAYPVTAVCLAAGAATGQELFTAGLDNIIRAWDLRMQKTTYTLTGHADTVTSLALSPDAQTLLSNAHDSTVRTWDVRPFAPEDRAIRTFDGAPTGPEKNLIRASWDSEGRRIAAGSGDGTATVWDSKTGKLLHKLPGHKGTVNDVRISPDGSLSKWRFNSSSRSILIRFRSPVGKYGSDDAARRATEMSLRRVDEALKTLLSPSRATTNRTNSCDRSRQEPGLFQTTTVVLGSIRTMPGCQCLTIATYGARKLHVRLPLRNALIRTWSCL